MDDEAGDVFADVDDDSEVMTESDCTAGHQHLLHSTLALHTWHSSSLVVTSGQ